ncbi:uncharacterized protein METZ01_LOCUS360890 [marine metagenome]|uniref:Uncharacterized protein n=1 Tax=marine metagenome TaxID=408172 RepID=A0A382SDT1_9ZZZZ
MYEEKLEEAYKILDQAAAMLMKEVYVNEEMGLKDWTPDCANHENRLSDLIDIQMSIIELQYRSIDLPVC